CFRSVRCALRPYRISEAGVDDRAAHDAVPIIDAAPDPSPPRKALWPPPYLQPPSDYRERVGEELGAVLGNVLLDIAVPEALGFVRSDLIRNEPDDGAATARIHALELEVVAGAVPRNPRVERWRIIGLEEAIAPSPGREERLDHRASKRLLDIVDQH